MAPRRPPSVDALATAIDDGTLPRALVVEVARRAVAEARDLIAEDEDPDVEAMGRAELAELRALRPAPVINATGVLLHTNLGRAPLPPPAAETARAVAVGYTPLEFDLTEGRRGGRGAYVRRLLTALTGAEDALVVNNNAGALLLALAALAGGREAIVSRGELIEIGGSFRLPDLMAASGATMVEVGTTNRTRLADYQRARTAATALVLKVHPSNYRVEGFTATVDYGPLAGLAHEWGVPLAADLGSGLLDARVPWLSGRPPAWLADEPAVRQTLEAGADLVLFSGDKLLGGPQAGIALGREAQIQTMAAHPMARALRCDGPTLAGLAATLELYASGRGEEIPFWASVALAYDDLERRALGVLADAAVAGDVVPGHSLPGAGSVPGKTIPSPIIRIEGDADTLWRRLLAADTPVIARREDDALVVDLRAVDPQDDGTVTKALQHACRS
ncbi:MAG: L-seryl-tRNA(Sec) selenium transferase [Acidimicrobiia bacterium]